MRYLRIFALISALLLVLAGRGVLQAQTSQLLQNSTFDSYIGSGGNVIPIGWNLVTSGGTGSSKQDWVFNEFPGFGASWKVSSSKTAFTMTGYQFVAGVPAGTKLRFSAFSNVFTCDLETSCIEGSRGFRLSQQESGARTRIGVDPTGGTDPNSANIQWTGFISPFDQFVQASIDFEVRAGNGVTVFLNATQNVGMLLNDVYWDNAALIPISALTGGPGQPPPTEVPRVVPFVTPQGQQPDGSIIHIVREGDTLASIAVAYNITLTELRKLNNIPEGEFVIQPGQRLIIKPPSPNVTYVVVTATFTPSGTPPTATPTLGPGTPTLRPTRAVTVITLAATFGSVVSTPTGVGMNLPNGGNSLQSARNVVAAIATNTRAVPSPIPSSTPAPTGTPAPTETLAPILPTATELPDTAIPDTAVPTALPSATPMPPTATPAGVALQAQESRANAIPIVNQPVRLETGLCVSAFDDVNQNRLPDAGEARLPGVTLRLTVNGQEQATRTTDGADDTCFTGIGAGRYSLAASAPADYGLTTPNQYRVEVIEGAQVMLHIGAASGYQSAAANVEVPPADSSGGSAPVRVASESSGILTANLGLVVLAVAAMLLVGGLAVVFLLRRR